MTRVRIAPSPTGYMHVGNARTVLFNWLYAKQTGGAFLWRVEDTDRERLVAGALEDFRDGLAWLGVQPDEGPFVGGPAGPYVQSERRALYEEHAQALVESGHAYPCFCTADRLDEVRLERRAAGRKGPYDGRCRARNAAEARARQDAGEAHTIRLKMPTEGSFTLDDVVLGAVTREVEDLYDIIVLKSDGWPTYHLAVVVDDHHMRVSHVIRADEWVSSTAYHLALYQAFGWEPPVHAHVPMVLNPDGRGKLAKRKTVAGAEGGAEPTEAVRMTQVNEYRDAGYLPEAMFNYLCLLGWSFSGDQDIFTADEAVARFRLEDVNPAPARWDPARLDAMNGHYLRAMAPEELAARLTPFLEQAGIDVTSDGGARLRAAVPLVQERITTLRDVVDQAGFLWADRVEVDPADLVPRKHDAADTARLLAAGRDTLIAQTDWSATALEEVLRARAVADGVKAGPLFQPIRVAVTGSKAAPPLFDTLAALGKEAALARIDAAIALLEATAEGACEEDSAP